MIDLHGASCRHLHDGSEARRSGIAVWRETSLRRWPKPRGGWKLVLMPGGMAPRGASAADTTLVKPLVRAFRRRRMMETGCVATIDELPAAEKINSSYVSRLLRLTLPGLMAPFPVEWSRQRELLACG